MENVIPTPTPTTLVEAIRYFSNLDTCLAYFIPVRWPNGITCPHCGEKEHAYIASRRIWRCKGCKNQYSAKIGTVMEDSPLGLDKWLTAIWLITNAKNGISSYEIHRALGITQKSAWFLLHRIRLAMKMGTFEMMSGVVESDETFIGGKAKNMHRSRRKEAIQGRGAVGKAVVHGILQRSAMKHESKVKAGVVKNTKRKSLVPVIRESVEAGSTVFTDALPSYNALAADFTHEAIDHAVAYVRGAVHTNGLENFWSLLKRGIHGTYVSVDHPHLGRYVDEQVFRFNERKGTDGERFVKVLPGVVGKRITYKELTGNPLVSP
jgi:transposase-like protein